MGFPVALLGPVDIQHSVVTLAHFKPPLSIKVRRPMSILRGRWACHWLILFTIIFSFYPVMAAEDRGDLVVTALSEETEAPVAGATVRVLNRSKTKVIASGVTDAQGKVRITGIAIGDVFVEVSKDGVGLDRSLMTINAGTDNSF